MLASVGASGHYAVKSRKGSSSSSSRVTGKIGSRRSSSTCRSSDAQKKRIEQKHRQHISQLQRKIVPFGPNPDSLTGSRSSGGSIGILSRSARVVSNVALDIPDVRLYGMRSGGGENNSVCPLSSLTRGKICVIDFWIERGRGGSITMDA